MRTDFTFIIKDSFHEIKVTKFGDLKQYFEYGGSHGCLLLSRQSINNVNCI